MVEPSKEQETVARLQRVFGHRFREARIRNRLSRTQVCIRAGLTLSQLTAIEQGELALDIATMVQLAEIVCRELHDLLPES